MIWGAKAANACFALNYLNVRQVEENENYQKKRYGDSI